MKVAKKLMGYLLIVLALYIFFIVYMYFTQTSFIYFPDRNLSDDPSSIGLSFESVVLQTEDDVKIHGWFIPHSDSKLVLLFCHGNGGNISGRLEIIERFYKLGMSIFIFDYRGYGKSEGKPTESGTYKDVEAAWKYLTEVKKVKGENIVVLGRSLGCAIGSYIAAKHKPAALILDSAFTSIPDMARKYYPFLPIRLMCLFKYSNIQHMQKVKCPVLIFHSEEDEIVPFEQGKKLFELASEPKMFVEIRGSHNDSFFISGNEYKKGLVDFLMGTEPFKKKVPGSF